ncbi:MAG: DUF1634 domain-containing protein [Thermodesulfobacteriota bacterium]
MRPASTGLNSHIARILKLGAYSAASLILVGVMALVMTSDSGFMPGTGIAPQLSLVFKQAWPLILINLGVLILMMTPIAWVLAAAIFFAKRKDVKLALVSAAVFGVLLFAIVFGLK